MHAARQSGGPAFAPSARGGVAAVHNRLRTCRYFFDISVTAARSAARGRLTHHGDSVASLRISGFGVDPEIWRELAVAEFTQKMPTRYIALTAFEILMSGQQKVNANTSDLDETTRHERRPRDG